MKRALFYVLLWTPLLLVATAVLHLVFRTNLPQLLYASSIRNIPFECLEFVPRPYVYKARPGPCVVRNLEYTSTLTHGADGFRTSPPADRWDVAVLGDSHAHGLGVADDETFAYLLAARHGLRAKALAVGSYATLRELEVLADHAPDAPYVVIQYCDNDANENAASRRLNRDVLAAQIEARQRELMASYAEGKALGLRKPLADLAALLRDGAYESKSAWRAAAAQRNVDAEAADFAALVGRYRSLLEGKRLVVLESSGWLLDAPRFRAAFAAQLGALGWLDARVLDAAALLDADDAFFLDDHIDASGHAKLAAAIAGAIAEWERAAPVLQRQARRR